MKSVRHLHEIPVTVFVVVVMLTSWGCSDKNISTTAQAVSPATEASPAVEKKVTQTARKERGPAEKPRQEGEKDFEDFDRAAFDRPTNIDNPWMPLKPGTRFVYEGTSLDNEGKAEPHSIEFIVTDLTKVVYGVNTVVAWIVDYADGELVEKEIAFYAQANDGTVWYFGEHPEEFEEGEFVVAPTWIAGVKDAQPGIAMPAEPQVGSPSYSQGWGPGVGWSDRAQVYKMDQKDEVPAGSYDDVMIMDEYDRKEPEIKLKYYARGVGNIRVGWRGEPESQETLQLVKHEQLDPQALAEVRAKAMELEANAYKVSRDVFALTEPSVAPDGSSIVPDLSPDTEDIAQEAHAKKITEEQAKAIALKAVPGEFSGIAIERKLGANRYVVEILAEDGPETDVIIDMETGEVLATET